MAVTVYGLYSPKDGLIRYIGQTTKRVPVRLRQHLQTAREGGCWPVAKWLRKLIREGHEVKIVALAENAEWNVTEIQTIARYRAEGFPLLNVTAGGEGTVGQVYSDAARQKMSAAAKARMSTPEGRESARLAALASWEGHTKRPPRSTRTRSQAAKDIHRRDPSVLARATEAARFKSADHRAKLSAATKAVWARRKEAACL